VDYVLPRVPWRQWTLAFPRRLRVALLKDEALLNKVLAAFVRTVFAFQRLRARKLGFARPLPGAVVFIQNFTDARLLHPHFHALFPDGVFEGKDVAFAALPPPDDEDVERLLRRVARRTLKLVQAVVLDAHGQAAAKVVEIKPPQLGAPVIWKDVGAFYLRPLTPIPFVPTDAQRNLMTDDALEDMVRMRREQVTSLVRFEASPALVRMVSRKKLLPKAERAMWEPWLALPKVEGASVLPREKWEELGDVFQLPVGRDLEPVRVPRELFVLFLRGLGGLRRAVAGRLLGGEAVREISAAWIAKGLPVELVMTELLG